MVTINGKEVEWHDTPKGWYLIDGVKWHCLWKDDTTGAMFILLKFPKGEGTTELPHTHPHANQMGCVLSGDLELPNGMRRTFGDGNYSFRYSPKEEVHGPQRGATMKILEETIILQYFDGRATKLNEGESDEITLE
jgi:hypothetical protein